MYVIRYMEIQMCAFQLFLTADLSLGRVDYRLMSDQTLMEMLIDSFDDETKKRYQDDHGMYLDVCKWSCVKCDADERVVKIGIDSCSVSGSIELCYVPPKVKGLKRASWVRRKLTGSVDLTQLPDGMEYLSLQTNEFSGNIDLAQLPSRMKDLCLQSNKITGEIDLAKLPDGMEHLNLCSNQLTGETDLTHLPDGIYYLNLGHNQLTGEVDLKHLPDGMKQLYLQNNRLTGEVNLTQLPDKMNVLHLDNNELSGPLVIKWLPSGITVLNAERNHFNAVAVINSETHAHIYLQRSGVISVLDENGREVDMTGFPK